MKRKRFLIILQFILCLLCFFNNWFKDNLFNSLIFIVPIIFDIVLVVMFLITYFYSFYSFKENKVIFKIATLLLCLVTIILSFYDFRLIKAEVEVELYKDQREIIIKKIRNNEVSYYSNGNIKLPMYKYVSSDGEVYVYKNDSDEQVIGFWIFRGVMSDSVQLIYSSNETLIHDNVKHISEIKKLDDNWYYVITE